MRLGGGSFVDCQVTKHQGETSDILAVREEVRIEEQIVFVFFHMFFKQRAGSCRWLYVLQYFLLKKVPVETLAIRFYESTTSGSANGATRDCRPGQSRKATLSLSDQMESANRQLLSSALRKKETFLRVPKSHPFGSKFSK